MYASSPLPQPKRCLVSHPLSNSLFPSPPVIFGVLVLGSIGLVWWALDGKAQVSDIGPLTRPLLQSRLKSKRYCTVNLVSMPSVSLFCVAILFLRGTWSDGPDHLARLLLQLYQTVRDRTRLSLVDQESAFSHRFCKRIAAAPPLFLYWCCVVRKLWEILRGSGTEIDNAQSTVCGGGEGSALVVGVRVHVI